MYMAAVGSSGPALLVREEGPRLVMMRRMGRGNNEGREHGASAAASTDRNCFKGCRSARWTTQVLQIIFRLAHAENGVLTDL